MELSFAAWRNISSSIILAIINKWRELVLWGWSLEYSKWMALHLAIGWLSVISVGLSLRARGMVYGLIFLSVISTQLVFKE